MKRYVVGGAVRDVLLGREPKDTDYVWTDATVADMTANGFVQVGADFPVFLDNNGDEHALARRERKVRPGYHGFEVEYDSSVTIEEDLSRRDLKINSMAVEVCDWQTFLTTKEPALIVDPFNGQHDLASGIISATSHDTFKDDPVRVLRALRFASRLDFKCDDETNESIQWCIDSGEMKSLTKERVWLEIEKVLRERGRVSLFFDTLAGFGLLDLVMPNLTVWNRRVAAGVARKMTPQQLFAIVVNPVNDTPKNMIQQLRERKVPNDYIELAVDCLLAMLLVDDVEAGEEHTNKKILGFFKNINAFSSDDRLRAVTSVVNLFDVTDVWTSILEAHSRMNPITFQSIPLSVQETLKGKQIGEEIDRIRLNTLE